jgi:hypothetical protein
MAIRFKYIGDGAFVPGLPARDLTDEDERGFDAKQRAMLEEHMKLDEAVRIYEAVPAPKGKPANEGE